VLAQRSSVSRFVDSRLATCPNARLSATRQPMRQLDRHLLKQRWHHAGSQHLRTLPNHRGNRPLQCDCNGLSRTSQLLPCQSEQRHFLIVQSAPSTVFDIWWIAFQAMLDSFNREGNLSVSGANISAQSPHPPATTTAIAPTIAPVTAITGPTVQPSPTPTASVPIPHPPHR